MALSREEGPFTQSAVRWRAIMERIAPFRGFHVPKPGEEILVHWIEAFSAGRNGFALGIGWRVHKPTRRGMGKGRPVAPEAVLRSLPASATAADRRVIESVREEWRLPGLKAPRNMKVVHPGDVDAILRALSLVPYVHWESSGERAAFDPFPAIARIVAEEDGGGLAVSGEWALADGREFNPASPRIFAGPWPWVEDRGILRPLLGVADGGGYALFMDQGFKIQPSEVPSFLGSGVPMLQSWGARVKVDAGRQLPQGGDGALPKPRLYLGEEGGALGASLRFVYGDMEILAENPDPVLLIDVGDGIIRISRDMDAELAHVQKLRSLGFRPSEPGRFEIEGERALDFMRLDLEKLALDWEVFGKNDLKRHRVRQQALTLNVRVAAATDWLDLYAEAQSGEDPVEIERVLKALRRGSRYVRLGDGSHALMPGEWADKIGELLEESGLSSGVARLPRYMVPVAEELLAAADTRSEPRAGEWRRLTGRLWGEAPPRKAPLPKGLACTLRPYQKKGYHWMSAMEADGFGVVLADDMGLGKTVQALALLTRRKEEGSPGPSLVVAPTSVVHNWEQEIARHAPVLKALRYQGIERGRHLGNLSSYDLVVTSYAILRRDIEELGAVDWDYVILDEAQAIKNAATQTARAAHGLKARQRLALTGTLLENHLGELWSHFNFLMPGLLGSQRSFVRRFERPILKGDEAAGEDLRRRIKPFILRRMKNEVAPELPPKVENILWSDFLPEQAELYRKILAAGRERVVRAVDAHGVGGARACVLDALLRLRQVCCHPAVLPGSLGAGVGSAKFDQFKDFVGEVIEEGNRILVYSQFVQVLKILKKWFERNSIPHLYMDGQSRDRERTVARFQGDESIPAFLISLKAGGTGLNLTGADYVLLFDPWWNPAVENQAADRAHRIGRERTVFFYRMVAKGSVEEKIRLLQERKKAVADDFVRSVHKWGLPSTREELLELFEE